MGAGVRVKLYPRSVRKLTEAQKKAVELTAEAVKSDIVTSAVVPKQVGILERSASVDNSSLNQGQVSVVYNSPYARRLYWHPEYDFRTDKNPNAQGKWMQTYIDGDKKDFAKKTFTEFLRQQARGVIK